MAVDASTLSQYSKKKVILVALAEDGTAVEHEGTAETATAVGVLLKPKGKVKVELFEPHQIEDIRLAPDTTAIKAKALKPVELGSARSHLLERHGFKLSDVNGMTEDAAFKLHEELNHVELDLGHVHQPKVTPELEAQPSENAGS